jgi:transposase-like protein
MQPQNKYAHRAKISEYHVRRIVKLFALDISATNIAELTDLNRDTVNRYLMAVRKRMAQACQREAKLAGDIEVDESYFGASRVRGKRGRGAGNKTLVFGMFKRDGNVYTEIVPDAKKATLQAVIRGKVDPDSVIHSDGWRGYDGLADVGYKEHVRITHSEDAFSDENGTHINGIEAFWGSVKTRLTARRGIRDEHLHLHLKECEFRWNHRDDDLYSTLLKLLRENPLFSS